MSMLTRFVVGFLIAACSIEADAGIIVTYSSSSPDPIVAGSTATINVFVATDAVSPTPADTLDLFLAEFALTPITGPSGGLKFASAQDYTYLSDSQYVFNGVSGAYLRWLPPGNQSPGTVALDQLTYSISDFTDDGSSLPSRGVAMPVTLSSTPLLLTQLLLETAPSISGTYQLSLSSDPLHTEFVDGGNNNLSFSSAPLTLTVVPSLTSVPEPSVSHITLAGLTALVIRRRSHRKNRALTEPAA